MGTFPLPAGDLASCGLRTDRLERLAGCIDSQIAEGRYPGAQIAIARHGRRAQKHRRRCALRAQGGGRLDPHALADVLGHYLADRKRARAAGRKRAVTLGDLISEHTTDFSRHGKRGQSLVSNRATTMPRATKVRRARTKFGRSTLALLGDRRNKRQTTRQRRNTTHRG